MQRSTPLLVPSLDPLPPPSPVQAWPAEFKRVQEARQLRKRQEEAIHVRAVGKGQELRKRGRQGRGNDWLLRFMRFHCV